VAGSADEFAVKMSEAIHWCETCLAHHGQWIGKDGADASGALKPRDTATVLVKMLADFGLGDYAAAIPIDHFTTHQLVVGLLTEYKNRFSETRRRIRESPTVSGPAPLREFFAPSSPSPAIDSDRTRKAALAREAADRCKGEAGGIQALLRVADVPPQSCRNVVATLIRMLVRAGQTTLCDGIDLTSAEYDKPLPVIALLAQMSERLERAASELESQPSHVALPPSVDQHEYLSPAQAEILIALLKARNPLKKEQLAAEVGLKEPHGSFGRDLKRLKALGLIDNRRHGYFLTIPGSEEARRRDQ
jgi:hypothetical protein